MSQPEKRPAVPNPFQSPALSLPSEPETPLGSATPIRPETTPCERPTPVEMLAIVVSVFGSLAVGRQATNMPYDTVPMRTVAYILVGLTLAAVPLIVIRGKTTSWREVSPGLWLWFGCACERCLYFVLPSVLEHIASPESYLLGSSFTFFLRGACFSLPLLFCNGLWWRATSLLEVLWSAFAAAAFLIDPNFINSTNRTLAWVGIVVTSSVGVFADWTRGASYGWSHWCGLLVFFFWTVKNLWPVIQVINGL